MTTPIEKFQGGAILTAEEVKEVKDELRSLRAQVDILERKVAILQQELFDATNERPHGAPIRPIWKVTY